MPVAVRRLLIFLALLIPSAQFAWRNMTMPQFSYLHDDGVFFVTAKSVAEGSYRIESLPERPFQTKFPPLYPLFLSLIWRLNPKFPDNLVLATWMSWSVFAALLGFVWYFLGRTFIGERRSLVVTALLALNPYLILFGCTMFSEVFFTVLVIATFLAARQAGAASGVWAAGAYLARTAGVALLLSAVIKHGKRAWRLVAMMLPFILAWTFWSSAHHPNPTDQTLMYYTDYTGYEFLNVGLSNIAVVLWKNLDGLLYGMGSLVLPNILPGLFLRILTQVIAVAGIVGCVRLWQRGIMQEYAAFALVSCCILLAWHFPPNERFVLPLYPLLLAGLITEIEHIWAMLRAGLRHKDFSQRAVAAGMTAGVAIIFAGALAVQCYVTFVYLHESAEQKAVRLADQRVAYAWMKANLPPDANVLSYDDPLLYLYSGHRGNYLPLLPKWWYAEDHKSIVDAYASVAEYCVERHLDYLYFTTEDLDREVGDDDRAAIQDSIRKNPELVPVYQHGIGTVYKVRMIGKM
jgi:hypothetical protein